MSEKDQQEQRDFLESERNFRLLVEGVADYALYMLDPNGVVTSWNVGGQRIKGYSPGDRRPAFFTLLHRGRSYGRQAATGAQDRPGTGPL
jgi:PAS domain-containing protein